MRGGRSGGKGHQLTEQYKKAPNKRHGKESRHQEEKETSGVVGVIGAESSRCFGARI